jgi:hypothetical protein
MVVQPRVQTGPVFLQLHAIAATGRR